MDLMRVRVWIAGPDGPSRDFELLAAPRTGERISVSHGGKMVEGVVVSVDWHLQAIEASDVGLGLDGEPAGSVSVVHVVCRPGAEIITGAFEAAEVDPLDAKTSA